MGQAIPRPDMPVPQPKPQTPPPDQPRRDNRPSVGFGGIELSFKLGGPKKTPEETLLEPTLDMRNAPITDAIEGQVLFFLAPPASGAARIAAACRLTILETSPLDALGTTMILARFAPPITIESAQACLARQPQVQSSQPNFLYQVLGGGSRARGYALHGLRDGNLTPVTGTIVMIDTAVDLGHANLRASGMAQYYVDVPQTPSAHGTAIAELLVGGGNYPGTALGANLISLAAFAPAGEQTWLSQSSSLAKALNATIILEPQVVNMSFGRARSDPIMVRGLDALHTKGVCVVAAAGNGSSGPVQFPASNPASLAVTAVDGRLRPYAYASRGPEISVAAWGVGLAAAVPGGRRSVSGTSFATAVVSGSLLRMPECNGRRDPAGMKAKAMTNAQDLGERGADPVFGAGLFRLTR